MKDRTTQLLFLIVFLLVLLAWQQGGWELALAGVVNGARLLWVVLPLLIAAFVIAGLVQVLVTQEMVTRWLGKEAGWRGIALACVGGALMPGGPYVYYPIAAVLLRSGASLGVLVAFVTAKNLWALSRLPLEFALLGPTLTLARISVTFAVPPLMGILAEWLFGGWVEEVRQGVRA